MSFGIVLYALVLGLGYGDREGRKRDSTKESETSPEHKGGFGIFFCRVFIKGGLMSLNSIN